MSLSITQLEFCHSLAGEAMLAAPLPTDELAAVTALRKSCDLNQAAAIMEVRDIRRRAAASGKAPPSWAARLLATDVMLQQASSLRVATYVARRLVRTAADREVWDLCSGMGINAIGLAGCGARVRGYDLSPEAVYCAAHNAAAAGLAERCSFVTADVTELPIDADAVVHIDPDRRSDGRRSVSLDDCSPNGDFLRSLPGRTQAGAMKLSPALPMDDVADWPLVGTEHVSENGVCKQLLLWWGVEGMTESAATIVFGDPSDPQAISIPAGEADFAHIAPCGQWIIEPDPAVIAAGATDDLAAFAASRGVEAWRIAVGLDWLSADAPLDTPLARCYHILQGVPGRQSDVARAVADLDGGIVEVKPRGLKLDTDAMQRNLRGKGNRTLTVLWCKMGDDRQQAFIAERRARS